VNLGGNGSADGSGIIGWCCWGDAEAEAEPAAMAACRRRLERLPRLATEGRGDGGGMEVWFA
jgi:hypothetical protein